MNFSKLLIALSVALVVAVGCKKTESVSKKEGVAAATKTAIDPKKLETATFNIEGMTCAIGCAKTIEKELSETNGVQKASVDFDKKEAIVSFDSSIQTAEALVKLVEATADGKTYKVSNVKTTKNQS